MQGRLRALIWLFSTFGISLGFGLAVEAQGPPPADLEWRGDHWSAWEPPMSVPEESQIYTIQQGDTLWDIAQRVLGDGNLWPQIWEQNQYILDAHWVYPGDPLMISGTTIADAGDGALNPPLEDPDSLEPPPGDVGPGVTDSVAAPAPPSGVAGVDQSAPVPIGYESDIYCTGFIGELEEDLPYSIAASEYEFLHPSLDPRRASNIKAEIKGLFGSTRTEKYGLGISDIIYLDSGRADGLSAGLLLTVVDPGEIVIHPITEAVLGRFYHYRGRIRVLSVQEETGIGEIIQACDPMHVDDRMRRFEPEPVPLRRITPMRPVNFPVETSALDNAPTIISARDKIVAIGTGHLVFIDRGMEDDVAPGDIFTVYRSGRRGFPPILLGEVGVLSVYKKTSLVRVMRSRYTVFVGDVLHLK